MTIWRMRIACWIPKATNTHSQNVEFTVFPLQKRLHERASLLRHTHVNTQQFRVQPTLRIYVLFVDLRTDSDYFPIQH